MPTSSPALESLDDKTTGAVAILDTVLQLLAGIGELRQRRMFGGVYIYCDDLFIVTVHDNKLYFKANANTAPAFIERKLKQFSYPKKSETATLQYYEAPSEVFSGHGPMKTWADMALLAAKQDAASKRSKSGAGSSTPSNARAKKVRRRSNDA